jgi:predicted Kef-type K+ transport protein
MTLDIRGLIEHPAALAGVPLVVGALLLVRGLPALVFRRDLPRAHLAAVSLLQATSLPFLLTVSQIGIEMGSLERTTASALVAAGVVSVVLFPPLALRLLASAPVPAIDAGSPRTTPTIG